MGVDYLHHGQLRHADPNASSDALTYIFTDRDRHRYGPANRITFSLKPGEYPHTNTAGHTNPDANSTVADSHATCTNSYRDTNSNHASDPTGASD